MAYGTKTCYALYILIFEHKTGNNHPSEIKTQLFNLLPEEK